MKKYNVRPREKKIKRICFAASEVELRQLEEKSEEMGISVSALVRYALRVTGFVNEKKQ